YAETCVLSGRRPEVAISQKSGDFVPSSLAQVMNTEAINSLVVQSWLEKAGSTLDELLEKKKEDATKQNKGLGITISNPDIDSVTSRTRRRGISTPLVPLRGWHLVDPIFSNAWVKAAFDLNLFTDGTQNWEVVYSSPWDIQTMKLILGKPIPFAGRSRRIALSATLADAVAAADSFAKQKLAPGNLHAIIAKSLGISLEAKSEEMAPEKEHMRAWCRIHNRRDLKNITKGAAADMITRLRRGAK
ncbi:2485_t:CDS:2, partial [Acaulospora colombiana]